MFWELDKIDIVTIGERGEEARQTDHRTAAEISRDPHVSVLLALSRVLISREHYAAVHYHCSHEPPAFFKDALGAAGATLHVGKQEIPASNGELEPLIDATFQALARQSGATRDCDANQRLLVSLEDETLRAAALAPGPERWAVILRLSALAAAGIGQGSWRVAAGYGSLPFVFTTERGTVNIAGKAERFLLRGEAHRPSTLRRALEAAAAPGTPCVVLKRPAWDVERACRRRLVDGAAAMEAAIPWVVAAEDRGDSLAFPKNGPEVDVDALIEARRAFLATVAVEIEDHGDGLLAVGGHPFAAEKILDRAFLRSMHARLGAQTLLVAAPCRGLLLISGAGREAASVVLGVAKSALEDAGEDAISDMLFLVLDGEVCGVANIGQELREV